MEDDPNKMEDNLKKKEKYGRRPKKKEDSLTKWKTT